MGNEKLLAEAKKRYPIGTIFECLHRCQGGPIVKEDHDLSSEGTVIRVLKGCGCIYDNGKWATIIKKVYKEEIINNYELY